MLYEFAITPDVFDPELHRNNPAASFALIQMLRDLAGNGVIANLYGDQWIKYIFEHHLRRLAPDLQQKIIACFKQLNDSSRIVTYPAVGAPPETPEDWLDVALAANQTHPLYGIVYSNLLTDVPDKDNMVELLALFDSPLWQERRRSWSLVQNASNYRRLLTPLLRHARSLMLIDPYLIPHEPRFVQPVELCIELMGMGNSSVSQRRIDLHISDPTFVESISAHVRAWANVLKPYLAYRVRFRIFMWRHGKVKFHDRYILTNQCGISIPGGLAYRPGETTWALLEEEDRVRRWQDFQEGKSPFTLVHMREIK